MKHQQKTLGQTGRGVGARRARLATATRLLVCLTSAVALGGISGCNQTPKVVYIPGQSQVFSLKKGDPAPIDGFLVPPNVMAEVGDCLAATQEKGKPKQPDWHAVP